MIELLELREGGGGRTMGYYAKGHYDRQEFAKLVEEHANETAEWDEEQRYPIRVPVLSVRNTWWRCVPNTEDDDGSTLFIPAIPRSRGAFRVTVTEHEPLAGWRGTSDARSGQSCWCPACGQPQRRNATGRALYEKKNRNLIWRTARDWTEGWVLMDGDQMTTSFPCKYIHKTDIGNAYCDEQLRKYNIEVAV